MNKIEEMLTLADIIRRTSRKSGIIKDREFSANSEDRWKWSEEVELHVLNDTVKSQSSRVAHR